MSNVDLAKKAYDSFSSGDMDTLRGILADDATWWSSDEIPGGGLFEGADAVIAGFGEIPQHFTSFSVTPEEFIDAGEYVVVRGTQSGSNDNGSFESRYLHLMRFADGKLVSGEFMSDSAKEAKIFA